MDFTKSELGISGLPASFDDLCCSVSQHASSKRLKRAHALQHCTALRDHLVVFTSSGSFESRLSVIVVVWPRGLTVPRNPCLGREHGVITQSHSLAV